MKTNTILPLLNRASFLLLVVLVCSLIAACNQGRSGPPALACGGGAKFQCPLGTYCDLIENCGGIDRKGVCKPIPQNCPLEDKVVCGCDQKNYSSACYANAQAVSVAYSGHCISD